MRSYILQITKNEITSENTLNPYTLFYGEGNDIEETYKLDDVSERQDAINKFIEDANKQMAGMFEQVGEDLIRYNGGADKYLQNMIESIRGEANRLNPKTIEGGLLRLRNATRCYCNTMVYPYDDLYEAYADDMGYYLRSKAIKLKEGDVLHVGGIIKYKHSNNA